MAWMASDHCHHGRRLGADFLRTRPYPGRSRSHNPPAVRRPGPTHPRTIGGDQRRARHGCRGNRHRIPDRQRIDKGGRRHPGHDRRCRGRDRSPPCCGGRRTSAALHRGRQRRCPPAHRPQRLRGVAEGEPHAPRGGLVSRIPHDVRPSVDSRRTQPQGLERQICRGSTGRHLST